MLELGLASGGFYPNEAAPPEIEVARFSEGKCRRALLDSLEEVQ
jgi:hypothetical protein